MRTFELVSVALILIGALWSLVSRERVVLTLLLGLTLIALVLHLTLEGAHWQMAPAYLAAGLLLMMVIAKKPAAARRNVASWAMIVLSFGTVCLSGVLPMFRLPKPTGPDAIGTRIVHLVDTDRVEEHDTSRKRELIIQIWYPAARSRNPYAPYRRREETTLLSSYQSVLRTHSRLNAPVLAKGAFPVLLFNPAWNGRRTQNTYQAEDLASHGYVVVAIDHPYNSEPVAMPGGRVIHAVPVPEMDFSKNTLQTIEAAAAKELATQTSDTIFVLNQLQAMNVDPESPFYGRLDTNNVGAFGHSFGGAVAAQACYDDPRIRAALDMDGSLWGKVQKTGLPKPFMFMTGDAAPTYTAEERSRFENFQRVDAALDDSDKAMFQKFGGYRVYIHGSSHFGFTDKAIYSPFKSLSDGGDIRPRREFSIVRQYALAFFDQTLRGKSSPLLNRELSQFPEAASQFFSPEAP
jgi:predicted dienelactone hydrolase